ncbi:putative response regulator and transcription factor RR-A-type family [Medicago truncatula]|uniref:Putative response regulator and transcription factor RR-A-type family n=1 Tax=Medicago truncatula TaxID=3880 RepID=G7JEK1_MEDTR|nr:response regulator receiver domain protein [Medicago truncatula]RHN59235.1 putative response regulator and transcription factor RR-A-type family [Medicago truncatula]
MTSLSLIPSRRCVIDAIIKLPNVMWLLMHWICWTKKCCFDVMLIDARMPNMDACDFVQHVSLQLQIPAIMMAVDSTKNSIMKSIECGACEYWTKPLIEKKFKTMWQHVARKGMPENKEYAIVGSSMVQANRKRGREDADASKETHAKTARFSWSPELHQRFLWAVNQLGLDSMILSTA